MTIRLHDAPVLRLRPGRSSELYRGRIECCISAGSWQGNDAEGTSSRARPEVER
jgi:hypothetical protein